MIRDSFIKSGRETKSPFITNPFRFAGVEWATALTNWLKRKPLTINGAAKTATFTDNFASDGWADQGTQVAVNSGVLDWDGGQNDDASVYDLTSVSDTAWVLRFKFTVDTYTVTSSAVENLFHFGLSSTAETGQGVDSQDFMGMYINAWSTSYKLWGVSSSDGENLGQAGDTERTNFVSSPAIGDYYITLTRDGNKIIGVVYSDSEYTEVIDSATYEGTNIPATLRYIKGTQWTSATDPHTVNGSIDDIEFYNGVTTVENIPSQQTAVLDEDFATDDWAGSSTELTISGGVLNWDAGTTVGNEERSIDLGAALDDTKFVLDFDITWNNSTRGASTSNSDLWFGIFSEDYLSDSDNTQDGICLRSFVDSTKNRLDLSSGVIAPVSYPQAVTFTTASSSGLTLYVRIIRRSDVLVTCQLFSDSGRTVLTEQKNLTVLNTVTGLRYVKVLANIDHADHTHDGTIDNVKVYDGITEVNPATLTDYPLTIKIQGDADLKEKTAETREDTFDSTTGWTIVDSTNIGIADGKLNWKAQRDGSNDAMHYDLGSGNVSDTKWTLDFDLDITTAVAGSSTSGLFLFVGLDNVDSSTAAQTATHDMIGCQIAYAGSPNEDIRVVAAENTTLANAGTVLTTEPKKQAYFVRLQRLSSTKAVMFLYSDKARNVLLERKDITITGTVTGLQYIWIGNANLSAGGEDHTFEGTIDNLRFWDGITNPVTQETATYTDDFTSYANTTEGDAAYPTSDTAKARVNPTNDNIDYTFTCNNSSTHEAIVHDLQDEIGIGNYLDSKFCVRFSNKITAHANSAIIYCGLTDQDESTGTSDAHTFIGCEILTDSTDRWFATQENASAITNRDTTTNRVWVNDEVLYWEIIRDNLTYTINLYTDSSYSILDSTAENTMEADYTNLQYLKFMNRDNTSATQAITGVIDDIQVWNGVTSPNTEGRKIVFTDNAFDGDAVEYASETVSYDPINGDLEAVVKIPTLTTGADTTIQMYYDYAATNPSYVPEVYTPTVTFEDDFTGTDDWTDDGNDIVVNTTTNVIDWACLADGAEDNTYYDLTSVSDTNWIVDFDITFDTVTSGSDTDGAYLVIALDSVTTVPNSTPHDALGIAYELDNTPSNNAKIEVFSCDALNLYDAMELATPTGTVNVFTETAQASETQYIRLIRNGATFTAEIYSDITRETLVESKSVDANDAGTVSGLRYLRVLSTRDNVGDHTFDGTINNVKFWNNISAFDREPLTYNSNYKAVYNLHGNSLDSTANGNDGTDTAVDYEQQNNSVGGGFNGTTSEIDGGSDVSLSNVWDGGGHVSAWINPKSDGEANGGVIIYKRQTSLGWSFTVREEASGFVKLQLSIGNATTFGTWKTTNAVIPINEMSRVEAIYNVDSTSNNPILIINGIKYTVGNGLDESSTPSGSRDDDVAAEIILGNNDAGTTTFDGLIDNVKVSDKIRPSSEGITAYNAEKSDSDIITAGDENTQ